MARRLQQRRRVGLLDRQVIGTQQRPRRQRQALHQGGGIGARLVGDDAPGGSLRLPGAEQRGKRRKDPALGGHGLAVGGKQEAACLIVPRHLPGQSQGELDQGAATVGDLGTDDRVGKGVEAMMFPQGIGGPRQVRCGIHQGAVEIEEQGARTRDLHHVSSRRQCIR